MLANQIAIAQIVSIQSYANYADSMMGRTANVLFAAGDALDTTVLLAELGAALQVVASAQVYYGRPWWNLAFLERHTYTDGRDNNQKRELGNLFEPYWQVRLVPTPNAIKAALFGSQLAGL